MSVDSFIRSAINNDSFDIRKMNKIKTFGCISSSIIIKAVNCEKWDILKKIKKHNLSFDKNVIKTLVYDKKNKAAMILMNDKNKKEILHYSIMYNNIDLAKSLIYEKNMIVPKYAISFSFKTANNEMIMWLLENNIKCKFDTLKKMYKSGYHIKANLVLNYKLKLLPFNNEDVCLIKIMKIMINFPKFRLNSEYLKDTINKLSPYLIRGAFCLKNSYIMKQVFMNSYLKLSFSGYLHKYINNCENDLPYLKYLIDHSFFKNNTNTSNDFTDALLELTDYIYGNVIEDSSICYNSKDCENVKNDCSIMGEEWKDIVLDLNKTIFKNNGEYCFVLQNLVKCWESGLNAKNMLIVPKYPENPYTREPVSPLEFYYVICICAKYEIKVPKIVLYFAKHFDLVLFTHLMKVEDIGIRSEDYIRDYFFNNGMKYIHSTQRWTPDRKKFKDIYNEQYYWNNYISPQVAGVLFAKMCDSNH